MEEMTLEQFNKFARAELDKVMQTLEVKSAEYARIDAFSNIRGVAAVMETSMPLAVKALVAKHLVSINQFLNDMEEGVFQCNGVWREKIGDTIVYLLILQAIVYQPEEPDKYQGIVPEFGK